MHRCTPVGLGLRGVAARDCSWAWEPPFALQDGLSFSPTPKQSHPIPWCVRPAFKGGTKRNGDYARLTRSAVLKGKRGVQLDRNSSWADSLLRSV